MLSIDDVQEMTPAYLDVINSVPKGNSAFQTAAFGTNHVQPQRTRRAVILEINSLEATLHENKERYQSLLADRRIAQRKAKKLEQTIRKMKEDGKDPDDIADREDELLKINAQIERDDFTAKRTEALANDALIKLQELIEILNKLPDCSRDEFEKLEGSYFLQRILQEAVQQYAFEGRINAGTIDTLMRIPVQVDGQDRPRSLKIGEIYGMVVGEMKNQFMDVRLPPHVQKLLAPEA